MGVLASDAIWLGLFGQGWDDNKRQMSSGSHIGSREKPKMYSFSVLALFFANVLTRSNVTEIEALMICKSGQTTSGWWDIFTHAKKD